MSHRGFRGSRERASQPCGGWPRAVGRRSDMDQEECLIRRGHGAFPWAVIVCPTDRQTDRPRARRETSRLLERDATTWGTSCGAWGTEHRCQAPCRCPSQHLRAHTLGLQGSGECACPSRCAVRWIRGLAKPYDRQSDTFVSRLRTGHPSAAQDEHRSWPVHRRRQAEAEPSIHPHPSSSILIHVRSVSSSQTPIRRCHGHRPCPQVSSVER